ncbi:hypothetical protein C3L33_17644, partial [Rhododendron williamsianum]
MINELRSAYYQALVLWNPSINKFKVLPRPQFPAGFSHEQAHGFSFIPRANDYKVVRLIHNQVKDSPKVEIYTLSTNSWRTWTGDGVGYTLTDGIRPAFINGAVHWIALVSWRNPICSVLAFHMEDEVFRVIPCPSYDPFRPIIFPNGELFVASEKLAYFVKRTSEGGVSWDLWVLEDYGVAEFWTKLHSIRSHTIESVLHPLQPPEEGEVLFSGFTKKELYSFDMGRQEVKQIEMDYGMQFEVINYTESLLLLNDTMPDSASDAMDFFKCKGAAIGDQVIKGQICNRVRLGYSRVLLLWNPSIKKFKILPKPRFQSRSSYELAHGFAFASRANDYKVVRLIHDKVQGEKLAYFVNCNIIEGVVSWDLWVLEDYGVAEFWTKLHTIRLHGIQSLSYPLPSLKKGEILFGGLNNEELYSYDLERQEIKEIEVDGVQDVINYTESLVLLNEGIHDSSDAMLDFEEKEDAEEEEMELV